MPQFAAADLVEVPGRHVLQGAPDELDAAAGDQQVDVGMVIHRAGPRVEHGENGRRDPRGIGLGRCGQLIAEC